MKNITYNIVANIPRLEEEIKASDITIALESIVIQDGKTLITFKADISQGQVDLLTIIIDGHDSTQEDPVEPPINVAFEKSSSIDNIPYVYATSKPLNHHVVFQGASDLPSTPEGDGIGRGKKLTFRLASTDKEVVKDFVFNDDVYLKDGYIISKDAPFGSTFDVEICHPLTGLVQAFCRNVPIYGTAWLPLNTEDRALLPKGLIVRITVRNSTGENFEDSPATFSMFGRLELYRKN